MSLHTGVAGSALVSTALNTVVLLRKWAAAQRFAPAVWASEAGSSFGMSGVGIMTGQFYKGLISCAEQAHREN